MRIIHTNDSIFDVPAQVILNPVNLNGVMGAGLAKQFKNKYPRMYLNYRHKCETGQFQLGQLHVHYLPISFVDTGLTEIIVNFPTKINWRNDSDYGIIEEGLQALINFVNRKKIYSIAIPPLGCGHGKLNSGSVQSLIEDLFLPKVTKYLKTCYLVRFL